MWLLSTDRAELHFFTSPEAVTGGYAILSHAWDDREQTFVETRDLAEWCKKSGHNPRDLSSKKVRQCCILAERYGHRWVWDDTCCIDKTSSSELSEVINSMFLWYSCAEICYVYLGDVKGDCHDLRSPESLAAFKTAKWHSRGWTLQELIAPSLVVFVSANWKTIFGNKVELADLLHEITGIPLDILTGEAHCSLYSVAERMAWASKRNTTRMEDEAYSLMGLFDISMPVIYGEGRQAFVRLQQEIMKGTFDTTLFAWGSYLDSNLKPMTPIKLEEMYQYFNTSSQNHVYLLAQSPKNFVRPLHRSVSYTPALNRPMQPYSQWQRPLEDHASPLETMANDSGPFGGSRELPRFSVSNYGLECRFPIIESDGLVVAVLLCETGDEHVGLLLHPSSTPVQDPSRRRYNVGHGFRYNAPHGQPGLVRLVSLGKDFYNMRVNGKEVTAKWRDIFITQTPPPIKRAIAPSLCSPLHSIAPVPPFRLPPWLVGRLAQLGMELLPLYVERYSNNGTPSCLVLASFEDVSGTPIEGIRVVLGTCVTESPVRLFHWAAAKPRTPKLDGYNLNSLRLHNCDEGHIEDWEGGTKVFGDNERSVRLSFSPSTVSPGRTLVVHVELEGSVYSAMKERKRVVLPPREDVGLAQSE